MLCTHVHTPMLSKQFIAPAAIKILYFIILYYIISYYIISYYIILYHIVYYIILYYISLYSVILYYLILYCIILHYTILYYLKSLPACLPVCLSALPQCGTINDAVGISMGGIIVTNAVARGVLTGLVDGAVSISGMNYNYV